MTVSQRGWRPAVGPLGERLDLVGVGEAMLLLQAPPPAPLVEATHLVVGVAGAELNACAAVARLGGRAALRTRVGADPPGERVRFALADLGVEDHLVDVDRARPTGLFLRETPADGSRRVVYHRAGSAASAMDEADADRVLWRRAPRAVLLSGVTAALGAGPQRLLRVLADRARERGTAVVVDANLRPALGGLDEAVALLRALLPVTDLLVLGDDESGPLLGATTPADVLAAAAAAGVGETVLKGAERGCWFAGDDGRVRHQPTLARKVVDTVGAGDAFTGGYLAARLAGASPTSAGVVGSQLAAGVLARPGDTAGLPDRAEARRLLAASLPGSDPSR